MVAAKKQYVTKKKVRIGAWCGDEALRISIKHGGSGKMNHLKKDANVSYEFWNSLNVVPRHIPGVDNPSDCFTKTLSALRLAWLIRYAFGLNVDSNEHGTLRWTPQTRMLAARIFRHKVGCSEDPEIGAQIDYGNTRCLCRL